MEGLLVSNSPFLGDFLYPPLTPASKASWRRPCPRKRADKAAIINSTFQIVRWRVGRYTKQFNHFISEVIIPGRFFCDCR